MAVIKGDKVQPCDSGSDLSRSDLGQNLQKRHHVGHFRPGIQARQSAAQGAEQALAFAARGGFDHPGCFRK